MKTKTYGGNVFFREQNNFFVAIKTSNLHPNIKAFLDFSVIEQGKPHEIAAAFW
jgi:hypothetical protein